VPVPRHDVGSGSVSIREGRNPIRGREIISRPICVSGSGKLIITLLRSLASSSSAFSSVRLATARAERARDKRNCWGAVNLLTGSGAGDPQRGGAGHPAPEPARHGGRAAPDAEAAENTDARAARASRGQAAPLRRREPRGPCLGRTPTAQGIEQPGGELASVHPMTGATTSSISAATIAPPPTVAPPGSRRSRPGTR
jgi:hypothetical protein